ncbi:hypothetical protein DNAM_620 [Pseudomonas phage BroderSalsa]|nr:hypothetical protein DNAM_620 [Pseudomonas phage BroderSalsa]
MASELKTHDLFLADFVGCLYNNQLYFGTVVHEALGTIVQADDVDYTGVVAEQRFDLEQYDAFEQHGIAGRDLTEGYGLWCFSGWFDVDHHSPHLSLRLTKERSSLNKW